MGGQALKNTVTRRYLKDEYFKLWKDIHIKFIEAAWQDGFQDVKFSLIPSYRSKKSFGDMDILVEKKEGKTEKIRKGIIQAFRPNEIVTNGDVISFDYEELQIDFIFVKPSSFDFALGYFSWNDLGNLIGRIAHFQGFKFGHKGLFKAYRRNGIHYGDVLVTDNFYQALIFLGYDPYRWQDGFETVEDIYRFVTTSRWFNPSFFDLNKVGHQTRIRDKKRPVYLGFLTWLKKRKEEGEILPINPPFKIIDASEMFLDYQERLEELIKIVDKIEERRGKFNGDIVKSITGLQDKALGEFIQWFKRSHGSESGYFESYLDSSVSSTIEEDINRSYCFWLSLNQKIK